MLIGRKRNELVARSLAIKLIDRLGKLEKQKSKSNIEIRELKRLRELKGLMFGN